MWRFSVLLRSVALAAVVSALTAACARPHAAVTARPSGSTAPVSSSTSATAPTDTSTTTSTSPSETTTRPATTTAPAGAPFASSVSTLTAADLPSSWHAGCPVGPDQLRFVHVTYWGFDAQAHTGTMVANAAVTGALINVFKRLYEARFPIRQMVPVDAFGGSDAASTAADNTAAFNCRYAVAPGAPQWSMHAYGEAIDVNPVENPYLEGGAIQPPNGAPYVDRSTYRPGMAVPGRELVSDFASIGWGWGGSWPSTPDYQHFSTNGR